MEFTETYKKFVVDALLKQAEKLEKTHKVLVDKMIANARKVEAYVLKHNFEQYL